MKTAFSTLACPGYDFQDITTMAADLGFDGIEVRGLGIDLVDRLFKPFAAENIPATAAKLRSLQLKISCFSSGVVLSDSTKREENLAVILEYIRAAKALGTKYVRVLGEATPAPEIEIDDEEVFAQLSTLLPYAEEAGVTLLVETNGAYCDTARLASVLNRCHSEFVGALWDIHHPYRHMGESPEKTVQNLGRYIRYVHVKDSVKENGAISYRMMGDGDMPLEDIMNALRSINFEGYLSLEWVKTWMPEMLDAGIVFPQYMHYMTRFLGKAPVSHALQDDKRHAGYADGMEQVCPPHPFRVRIGGGRALSRLPSLQRQSL